jgi:hypothetical protein
MQNKIKPFFSSSPPPTPEELEKYLSGQLSAEERKALEKRIESSDFYTEGVEGLESMPAASSLSKITQELNARIDKKINNKSRFNYLPYWSAAAVLVLVCGLVFTFFRFQSQQEKIAVRNEAPQIIPGEDLAFSSSDEAAPLPSGELLKEEESNPTQPQVTMNSPIAKADNEIHAELSESVPSASYNESKMAEEVQAAPAVAQEGLMAKDYSGIFDDMLAFAEGQISNAKTPPSYSKLESHDEGIVSGYSSGRKPSDKTKEKSQARNASVEKEGTNEKSLRLSSKKNNTDVTMPSTASIPDLHQELKQVLSELKDGDVDVAEGQLTRILNHETLNSDLVYWIKAMIHLKKNQRHDAIIALKKIEKTETYIGKEAQRILRDLEIK